MLDEFEAISKHLDKFQDWGDDWRSKNNKGLLTIVIASSRPLEEIYNSVGATSPFGNIFSRIILGELETESFEKLILDSFSLKPHFFRAVGGIEFIKYLAGKLPFYTQMLSSILWQYENFIQGEKEFKFQAKPRFQELWNDLTPQEKQALRYTLNIGNISQPSESMIDNLKRHGLLTQQDIIFSNAFAEFIKQI